MRRIGEVVRVTGSLAVVRSTDETYPDLGTALIDEELSEIGSVVDVFGPVEQPYLAVTPSQSNPTSLLGNAVYARSE